MVKLRNIKQKGKLPKDIELNFVKIENKTVHSIKNIRNNEDSLNTVGKIHHKKAILDVILTDSGIWLEY